MSTLISSEVPPLMSFNKTKPRPETEQKLLDLQEAFLADRSSLVAYQELFFILHSYARSLILKKTKGKIYLPKDLVDNATLEACVKFMQSYEKPNFKIDTSFAGLLNLKILESLYGPKIQRNDKIASLSTHVDDAHKKEIELGDIPETLKFTYLFRPTSYKEDTDPIYNILYKNENIVATVMSVITAMYDKETLKDYILLSMAILHFFRKKKRYDRYRNYYLSPELKGRLDNYLAEIRQRLLEYA